MYLFLATFLIGLGLLLSSCQPYTNIKPKSRPQPNRVVTRKEQAVARKELPGPERRKVEQEEAKKRHVRMANASKHMTDLTFEELAQLKDAYLEQGDKEFAIKCIDRMIILSSEAQELKDLRIELADLHFDLGNLEQAETTYNDYINFYPGSDLIEYATYKSILSAYYQTLEADRDQSKTHNALALAESFLNHESFKEYADDVHTIKKHCITRAFESELQVYNFYMSQNKVKAAATRVEYMKEHFASSTITPKIIMLEAEVALRQGNTQLFNDKQQELIALNKQGIGNDNMVQQLAQVATPTKKNYISKF